MPQNSISNRICKEIIKEVISSMVIIESTEQNVTECVTKQSASIEFEVYLLNSTKYKRVIKCAKCRRIFVKFVDYYTHSKKCSIHK